MQKSLLQTAVWADFKARHGWEQHQLGDVLLLERSLPLGTRLLYAPEVGAPTKKELKKLFADATLLGKKVGAFVVRIEFFEEWTEGRAETLRELGLRKAFEEVQPEYRQWIPINLPEEELLAQMKPKGRYNIRVAEKHGVRVEEEMNGRVFFKLFAETAKRDGFQIRNEAYYLDLIETLRKNGMGALLVAREKKTVLAAMILSYYDGLASYLYGASSSENRQMMAPYLLHWEAIKRAKEQHCTTYDLLAIAPFDVPMTHNSSLVTKYAGITRFKTQFGGRSVKLLGSWDLVLHPLFYAGFKLLETARRS